VWLKATDIFSSTQNYAMLVGGWACKCGWRIRRNETPDRDRDVNAASLATKQ